MQPAIISIIGWHAGESVEAIVRRKRDDITNTGRTIWLYHSQKAPIAMVQQFGQRYRDPAVIFLRGSAFPAGTSNQAVEMSEDRRNWNPLPVGIGKVTGKLPAGGLLMSDLALVDHEIDLWRFVECPDQCRVRFRQGASTACVVPTKEVTVDGMKSRFRQVVAIGKLTPPYGVFLR